MMPWKGIWAIALAERKGFSMGERRYAVTSIRGRKRKVRNGRVLSGSSGGKKGGCGSEGGGESTCNGDRVRGREKKGNFAGGGFLFPNTEWDSGTQLFDSGRGIGTDQRGGGPFGRRPHFGHLRKDVLWGNHVIFYIGERRGETPCFQRAESVHRLKFRLPYPEERRAKVMAKEKGIGLV